MKFFLLTAFMILSFFTHAQRKPHGREYVYNYDKSIYSIKEYKDGLRSGTWITYERNGNKVMHIYSDDSLRRYIKIGEKKDTVTDEHYVYEFQPSGQLLSLDYNSRNMLIESTTHRYNGLDSIKYTRDSTDAFRMTYHSDSCFRAKFIHADSGLQAFLMDQLEYPASCREMEIMGTAVISFNVEPDGSVSDVVATGAACHPKLEQEAIRVVKKMSHMFVPTTLFGKPVRSFCMLPITFELEDE
jgi:TonB family protein